VAHASACRRELQFALKNLWALSPHFARFSRSADFPVLVRSPFAAALKRAVPHAEVTRAPGPHGWDEAVLEALAI